MHLQIETSHALTNLHVAASTAHEPRGEREIIEAAFAESRGPVAGPSGAAAKLRVLPSTLEHKIKVLRIRKSPFKFR